MKVIAISQHKGGVGKTTTAINLGAALARRGYAVLLIDLDAQANLTDSVGVQTHRMPVEALIAHGPKMKTIADVLDKQQAVLPIYKTQCEPDLECLDIVPASLDLAGSEAALHAKVIGRELVLKGLLNEVRNSDGQPYDFVIIDCPPSLGLLTINALAAADDIIIPVQAQYLAVRGLNSLTDIINLVRSTINSQLKIFGVLVTQYDSRKVLNRDTGETLAEMFDATIFKTKIRDNVALAEAPTAGQSIFEYQPTSNGAADYTQLADEILDRYKLPQQKQTDGKAQTV